MLIKFGAFIVTGASESGVTTLGRALAGSLAVPRLDTDDFYQNLPSVSGQHHPLACLVIEAPHIA